MRTTRVLPLASLGALILLGSCVPDLSTVCPYKEITQGVFGEIDDSSGKLEKGVEVSIYTLVNGQQDALVASGKTTRGGFQFKMDPSTYQLCVKGVCTNVVVPTGLVEQSGVDAATFTWSPPVTSPSTTTVGSCTYGE